MRTKVSTGYELHNKSDDTYPAIWQWDLSLRKVLCPGLRAPRSLTDREDQALRELLEHWLNRAYCPLRALRLDWVACLDRAPCLRKYQYYTSNNGKKCALTVPEDGDGLHRG